MDQERGFGADWILPVLLCPKCCAGCANFVAAAILAAVEGARPAARTGGPYFQRLVIQGKRSAGRDATALRQAGGPPLLGLPLRRAVLEILSGLLEWLIAL